MALEAALPVLALPEVVVDLARLVLLVQLPLVLAELPLLVQLPVLVQLELVVDLARLVLLVQLPLVLALLELEAEVAVEVVPLTRSFSAAMAEVLPPPGPPMYTPVPRSRRKPKRRPCPLA